MMILGTTFCILGWKVTKDEEKKFYAASISSATVSNTIMALLLGGKLSPQIFKVNYILISSPG